MSKVVSVSGLSFLSFLSFLGLAAAARDAAALTKSFNSGCCCEDLVPCTVSSTNPTCVAGLRGDDSTLRACGSALDFIDPFSDCFGKSCISLGEQCISQAAPNSYLQPPPPVPPETSPNGIDDNCDGRVDECTPNTMLACTTNLRSCSPAIGSVMCGADGFPAGACVATSLGDADICPKAACKGGVINNTDSDADGLFDCWETEGGIDYDGNGTIDFALQGANPRHVDLYVEADYFDCSVAGGDCGASMHFTHKPSPAAVAMIVATYANAPIGNLDGVPGITMHLDLDEALPHRTNCAFDDTCYNPIKQANFGTAAERANANTRLAKRLVYRYALWGHNQAVGDRHSGISGSPSADLMVTLGSTPSFVGNDFQQAATFVHELGHVMGLGHGGGDAINYKPNYLSVMNYAFQATGVMPGNVIDYSHSALPRLVETFLVEDDGIFDSAHGTTFRCPGYKTATVTSGAPINWDCQPAPNGPTDILTNADVNGDRVCVLAGPDGILQSVVGPGDDLRGGVITAGPDGVYTTIMAGGDDGYEMTAKYGLIIGAGANGILETTPNGDDAIRDQMVWDGPDRLCNTVVAGDDTDDDTGGTRRMIATTQPVNLDGFNDWDSLLYDFTPHLHGFKIAQGAQTSIPIEMTTDQMAERAVQAQLADLRLTQSINRTADGNVVVQLTLVNDGPSAAVGAVINDRLPAELTYRSCSATGGGTCSITGRHVAVPFNNLASGASGTVTITACSAASTAITNVATVNSITTDPNPANNTATGQVGAPTALPAVQQANGDMRYAITFAQQQAYVEAFVRVNGVQVTSGNIVGSKVTNADGTFTYSRVVAAAQYHAGDVINVRFYAYRSGQPGVYFPGPVENLSYPDFVYGTGSATCATGCRPTFKQLANGDVKVTHTFSTPQAYVEAFVRVGTTQVAAGNIVQSGVANLDGTFTYTRIVPASMFHNNDVVTFRFYSYVTNGPQVFTPGPTASTYYAGFTYNHAPTSDCP